MEKRSKPFRNVALAVVLSIGSGVIWGCLFGGAIAIILMLTRPSFRSDRQELLFTNDGTPVIQTVDHQKGVALFHDLNGKPLNLTHGSTNHGMYFAAPRKPNRLFQHLTWARRIRNIHRDPYGTENWFLILDEKCLHCYLVGYSLKTKEKIGYIGRNGFQEEKPLKEEQFAFNIPSSNFYWNIFLGNYAGREGYGFYLLTSEGLVEINPEKRSAKIVLKQEHLVSVRSIPETFWYRKTTGVPAILLRTPDELLIFNTGDSKVEQTYKLPEKLRKGDFRCARFWKEKYLVTRGDNSKVLLWIDQAGNVVKRQKVELQKHHLKRRIDKSYIMAACVPSPGLFGISFVSYPWEAAEKHSLGYWAALGKCTKMYWPTLVFPGIVSIVLAVLCYRRQRKYGLGWTWVWVGLVLLFGIPAYLGYLAHRTWPAQLPCPGCGELAPRDREACLACHQKFPAPALTGTEVFA